MLLNPVACVVLELTGTFCIIAKDLTLEEIDVLWADEAFRNARSDLRIIHGTVPEVKGGGSVTESKV